MRIRCIFAAQNSKTHQRSIGSAAYGGTVLSGLPVIARAISWSGVVVDASTLLLDLGGSDAGSVIELRAAKPMVVIQSPLQLDPE